MIDTEDISVADELYVHRQLSCATNRNRTLQLHLTSNRFLHRSKPGNEPAFVKRAPSMASQHGNNLDTSNEIQPGHFALQLVMLQHFNQEPCASGQWDFHCDRYSTLNAVASGRIHTSVSSLPILMADGLQLVKGERGWSGGRKQDSAGESACLFGSPAPRVFRFRSDLSEHAVRTHTKGKHL
jgi:hypothetical protein